MKRLALLILLAIPVLYITPVQADELELFNYWNQGNDTDYQVYGDNWGAQTFTVTETYTIQEVRLKLRQVGGSVAYGGVGIWATSATGTPTGGDLVSVDFVASTITTGDEAAWIEIPFKKGYELQEGEAYAVVTRAEGGNSSNYLIWEYDNGGGMDEGAKFNSTNGGVSWGAATGSDFLFETWGDSNIAINSVQVWADFVEIGDWLVTAYYNCQVPPYISEYEAPEKHFNLQLIDGSCSNITAVVAQSPIRYWGYRPGSIYISAKEAAGLEWGGNYSVRLNSAISNTCSAIGTDDWRGQNMKELDLWCLQTAEDMENQDGLVYLAEDIKYGTVIREGEDSAGNPMAGAYFKRGIYGLEAQRGNNLFASALDKHERETSFTDAMTADTDLEDRTGSYVKGVIDDAADVVNLSPYMIGFVIFVYAYFSVSRRVPVGHIATGLLLSLPLIFIAMYIGSFQWLWFMLVGIVAVWLFGWYVVLGRT